MILRDSHGVRAIYHPCELCGTVRLVRLDGGKPRTLRCKKCARTFLADENGPRIRRMRLHAHEGRDPLNFNKNREEAKLQELADIKVALCELVDILDKWRP
ncbi:hypothetical protein LCGC14_0847120 [marine sediment metagenome]|uniref:Uncharacterized protein n=1 Tax=marine sediment metagenome TaxID=412755 RepID=A0A0F9PWQ3_9ZZZZ